MANKDEKDMTNAEFKKAVEKGNAAANATRARDLEDEGDTIGASVHWANRDAFIKKSQR